MRRTISFAWHVMTGQAKMVVPPGTGWALGTQLLGSLVEKIQWARHDIAPIRTALLTDRLGRRTAPESSGYKSEAVTYVHRAIL